MFTFMQQQVKEGRNPALDMIKGVAIWLVVLGHGIQFIGKRDFFGDPFFKVIYSFHMPLFMLVSGYLFFLTVSRKPALKVISDKAKSIILPIISWRSLSLCMVLILNIHFFNDWNIKSFIAWYVFSYWFLWALCLGIALIMLVRICFKDSLIAYGIIWIALTVYSWRFSAGVFMYPYFVVGYLIHQRQQKILLVLDRLNRHVVWFCLGGIYVILMSFWETKYYIYTTGVSLWGSPYGWEQLWIDSYRWIVGMIGSLLCIKLILFLIKERFLTGWFARLMLASGKASLGIYIISDYFMFYTFPVTTDKWYTFYGNITIQSIVIILLCLGVTWLLRRSHSLSLLFLGGR